MISQPKSRAIAALLLLASWDGNNTAHAFAPPSTRHGPAARSRVSASPTAAEGFAPMKERPARRRTSNINDENKDVVVVAVGGGGGGGGGALSVDEAKAALIDLVPRMTGIDAEYRAVESYINLLEERYTPVLTLDFLNLAMAGEWQLLFSTNLLGRPNRRLRLRGLVQRIDTNGLDGHLTNVARWDYAEDEDAFDANGNFSIKCSYSISRGSRMAVDLNDRELRPAWGSKIPEDVPTMVGYLHRAIPGEIFDPDGHSMDTTYLDANLRIVRLTGPNHEGVRNVFMRNGSLEISPM
ncbi:hypothetical protein ACHAW5_010099 [Stephanodiscus triporus]|uniref:Plastid lipid-associated protein/fibrillin conserved domain-containing protein n=1 Tax=Stephanodiscus triporus TaxID=2934178 RepID=A0ABD3P8W0_9STRA